jgi:hypothetical protein
MSRSVTRSPHGINQWSYAARLPHFRVTQRHLDMNPSTVDMAVWASEKVGATFITYSDEFH